MTIDSKASQLIQKLTRATVEGTVSWVKANPPPYFTHGTENIVPLYLQCKYKEKPIGIFEKRYKYFHDELEYSWSTSVGLCILDHSGNLIWEYDEGSTMLFNLFELAREQSSGIDDILDDLLND